MSKNSTVTVSAPASVSAQAPAQAPTVAETSAPVATVPATAPAAPVNIAAIKAQAEACKGSVKAFAVQVSNAANRINDVTVGPDKIGLLVGVPNATRVKIAEAHEKVMVSIHALMIAISEVPSDAKPDPMRSGVVALLKRASVGKSSFYAAAPWRRMDLVIVSRFGDQATIWYDGCKPDALPSIPAKDLELSDATEAEREAFLNRAKEAGIRW